MSEFGRVCDVLSRAIGSGRLHHAILLHGPSIKGLEEIARFAAQKLLKTQDLSKHPDFFELRPEGKARFIKIGSESERVGGNWAPNTMRRLLHNLRQTPNAGGRKFALIHEADRMNIPTANAFLKTLEEPPADTNIFMISERPNELLDTIRSRCINLRADCKPAEIDDDGWAEWISDFGEWQKKLSNGISREFSTAQAFMGAYSLLARFDEILGRMSELGEDEFSDANEGLDAEQLAAIEAGERRGLRKRMLSAIEETLLSSVMEASEGRVPSVKLGRAVEALEKCSGFMELNMQDTPALEYFFLQNMRIWSR
jgi:DNA polymerase-3 subunit delta'